MEPPGVIRWQGGPVVRGMIPNVGPMEILLVLIVALIVFGPKRLPELGRSVGKGLKEFKGSVSETGNAFQATVADKHDDAPADVKVEEARTHA